MDDAIEAVTGVAEAGKDVADVVEFLVQSRQYQRAGYVQLIEQLGEPGDPLRGRDQADAGDVISAALDQELHGRPKCAAGGEHGVKDVALSPGQVARQPLGVRSRQESLFIADHADEPDLSRRHEPTHTLQHAKAGTQNRHHQRPRR